VFASQGGGQNWRDAQFAIWIGYDF
jgi:hypothetical protein